VVLDCEVVVVVVVIGVGFLRLPILECCRSASASL
jgi:hypothetical protein